jgi:precorrin-6A synthase
MRRICLIGIGPGDPDQVTLEAVRAMRGVDYFVVTDKAGGNGDDPLVLAREELLRRHLDAEPRIVRVADPARERRDDRTRTDEDYRRAVADWHEARAEVYESALEANPGDAGFLVWGDPAFYDSAVRILERVLARGRIVATLEVVPGVSSIQLLAARHRLVLHEVGQPLFVTTGRKLRDAIASGQQNIVVLLNRELDLNGLDDWQLWWGANLGTASEELVAGRVGDVVGDVEVARRRAKAEAGWVMDVFVLRKS